MGGTLRVAVELALSIVLPLLLQRWDKARLRPEQRDRAWNGASWGSALYNFGELSMLGWFWVTRGFRPAALLGFPTSLALWVLVHWVVDKAFVRAFGLKDDTRLVEVVGLWVIIVVVLCLVGALAVGIERLRSPPRCTESPPPRRTESRRGGRR